MSQLSYGVQSSHYSIMMKSSILKGLELGLVLHKNKYGVFFFVSFVSANLSIITFLICSIGTRCTSLLVCHMYLCLLTVISRLHK